MNINKRVSVVVNSIYTTIIVLVAPIISYYTFPYSSMLFYLNGLVCHLHILYILLRWRLLEFSRTLYIILLIVNLRMADKNESFIKRLRHLTLRTLTSDL